MTLPPATWAIAVGVTLLLAVVAFAVSTWHKPPGWMPSLMDRAATSSMAIVRPGPVPAWLPRLGERHRRRAQRRMFGGWLGRPMDDPDRWTSYFLAPLCQGYSGDGLQATAPIGGQLRSAEAMSCEPPTPTPRR